MLLLDESILDIENTVNRPDEALDERCQFRRHSFSRHMRQPHSRIGRGAHFIPVRRPLRIILRFILTEVAVIVGDWVYIHMGEVAVGDQPYSEKLSNPKYERLPVNATLSLNIGSSWNDPRALSFQAFPKTESAIYKYGTLWYDEKKNEVFTFGGEQSDVDDDHNMDLATDKLIPTSDGYGTWSINSTERSPPFSDLGLTRPVGGATAQSETTGFWLGGLSSNRTSEKTKDLKNYAPTPNLVTYEFATGAWANMTLDRTLPLGIPNGSLEWAGMEYLPKLGPNGMLVIWGGETSNNTGYIPGSNERPMTNIVLHDPVSKRWFTQQTDGTAPFVRNQFCSVSATDPRPIADAAAGTHEIFMYGGYAGMPGPGAQQYDEIWALSLPAFTWHRVDAGHDVGRIGHTCHLVGKRQMLAIGGVNIAAKDPWAGPDSVYGNGIGVFDLSGAVWAPGLNTNAADYQRPKIVQDSYMTHGAYPQTWTQQSLASLIINENPADGNNGPLTGPPPNVTKPSWQSDTPSPRGSNAGVIAGATIGGLVAAILPFVILYFYFYRYRPNRAVKEITELPSDSSDFDEKPYLPSGGRPSQSRARVRGRSRGRSMTRVNNCPVELDAGEAAGELGRPTPVNVTPSHTTVITGGSNAGGHKSGPVDYFSFLKPSGWKTPHLITPGVKEVPLAITPKGSQDGGRPNSPIPRLPHISQQFLRVPDLIHPYLHRHSSSNSKAQEQQSETLEYPSEPSPASEMNMQACLNRPAGYAPENDSFFQPRLPDTTQGWSADPTPPSALSTSASPSTDSGPSPATVSGPSPPNVSADSPTISSPSPPNDPLPSPPPISRYPPPQRHSHILRQMSRREERSSPSISSEHEISSPASFFDDRRLSDLSGQSEGPAGEAPFSPVSPSSGDEGDGGRGGWQFVGRGGSRRDGAGSRREGGGSRRERSEGHWRNRGAGVWGVEHGFGEQQKERRGPETSFFDD